MPAQYSSTAQDLMRGKPSEIDFLNGYVVRRGDALGVPTPANRVLWTAVKLMEKSGPLIGAEPSPAT
jgi:2-dehydropantoate 2-reductase